MAGSADDQATASLKQMVAGLAASFAGSHYVWGAAGNTPGSDDGAPYRKSAVTLLPNEPDPQAGKPLGAGKKATLFAASCSVAGFKVCAGRCDVLKSGTRCNLNDMEELKKQMEKADDYLWPRPGGGDLLWGKDCRGKRHFDCISLINYCLSNVLQKTVQFTLNLQESSQGFIWANLRQLGAAEPPMDGDILTPAAEPTDQTLSHIAMAVGGGAKVAQAEDTTTGVTVTGLTRASWNIGRLPNWFWKIAAAPGAAKK